MFESGMTQQVTNVLRSIRGRSLALDTGSYCIAETENGYVQFMADPLFRAGQPLLDFLVLSREARTNHANVAQRRIDYVGA